MDYSPIKRWLRKACRCWFPELEAENLPTPEVALPLQDTAQEEIQPPPVQTIPADVASPVEGMATAEEIPRRAFASVDPSIQEAEERDRRGNSIAATRRESSWSVELWRKLDQDKIRMVAELARSLADKGKALLPHFEEVLDLFDEDRRNTVLPWFQAPPLVLAALERLPAEADGPELCELLLNEDVQFRELLDLHGNIAEVQYPDISALARRRSFFEDRGRQLIDLGDRRRESLTNRHAGITDRENQTASTEDFFRGAVGHAKDGFERIEESETVKKFLDSGTPFISGVSGVIQQLAMLMEVDTPADSLSEEERQHRETIIGLMAAMLVVGGTHSMMEGILPAQAYGYFTDVPNPLDMVHGYDEAMAALERRFGELGLTTTKPLSAQVQTEEGPAVETASHHSHAPSH